MSNPFVGSGLLLLALWASTLHAAPKPVRQILRVGTTEDSRPFSYRDLASQELKGIDIDLAGELARFLGLRLQFVKTSWPSLRQDYEAGRFDVAMSGIARTPEREKWALFSRGYSADGKTPIARCDQKKRFDSLDKIDRPGVRVIVNPGGTNQKFASQRLRRAKVVLFEDNTRIFDQLIEGKADVMVTDAIEVSSQTALHRELCATMPGTKLDPSEKAILVARDEALRKKVDVWLDLLKSNGKLAAIILRHASP